MANDTILQVKLPNGTTYDIVDNTALHSVPMASSTVLGGVKIPVSGNITIDANGFIDTNSTGPSPSDNTPAAGDIDNGGNPGVSSNYSRADHVHPGNPNKVNMVNTYGLQTTYLRQTTNGFEIKNVGAPPREYTTSLNFSDGSLTIGGHSVSIKNLVTPTNNTDAATKKYVDDAVAGTGGGGTVTSVRVQGTAPISSSVNTAQTGSLDTTISISDATTTASGAMSAADKIKIDGISVSTTGTIDTTFQMLVGSANGIRFTSSGTALEVKTVRNNSVTSTCTLTPTTALTDAEVDAAIAAAVTVNNANTTSY